MNAHPHSVQLATAPETPALPEAPGFAHNLLRAARTLVPQFEAGRPIDAAALRAAMEDTLDLPFKSGEHQLRNQEVFYGKRKQADAGVSA